MVFRMGVPFAQVSDRSTTCFPSLLCYHTMAERHAFEQCSQLSVHPGRRRRFGNEHPLSVNGAEEKSTGFRRGDGRLHMCGEDLKRTSSKVQQDSAISGPP